MSAGVLPPSEPDKQPEQPEATEEDTKLTKAAQDLVAETPGVSARDRYAIAELVELDPGSLVGSYFHRVENGSIVWDGLVVGDLGGCYLLDVTSGLAGAEQCSAQIVLPLDALFSKDEGYEFRFYDSASDMREAFAEYLTTEGGE